MIKLNANKELDRVVANALVGSVLQDPEDLNNEEKAFLVNQYNACFVITDEDSELWAVHKILIPYESAILDPRLLIGEDVPIEVKENGEWCNSSYNHYHMISSDFEDARIPKQWLKDNGMWVEEVGE